MILPRGGDTSPSGCKRYTFAVNERAYRATVVAGMAAAYWAAAKAGLTMALVYPNVGSVWPASAVGLVGALIYGRYSLLGVFAGALLSNLQYTLSREGFSAASCVLVSLAIAASNALEAAVGSWAAERVAGGCKAFERGLDVLKLSAVSGVLCTTISASLSVPALAAAGMLPNGGFGAAWLNWWFGGAAGVLVWAPMGLAWLCLPKQPFKGGALEGAALGLLLGASVWLTFWQNRFAVAYIVIPTVIWSALRYGTRGSAVAVLLLSIGAMAGTAGGRGELATGNLPVDAYVLQGFLATIAVSSYAMAALVWEREQAEDALRRSRDHLESEVQRRTTELLQAQKMEAVARLSGVVAHEFKNSLAGISGFAELIRLESPAGSRAALDAAEITAACRRSVAVAGRLLSLSRGSIAEKRTIDLNELVTASAKTLRLTLGDRVRLELELDPANPAAVASPDQLEQVLLNFCVNARDAMGGAGRVEVSTRLEKYDAPRALSHGSLPPGDWAALAVRDTGAGVPEELRERIFEPFFTTKESGEGTGLGLAIVKEIVRTNGGAIHVASRPGDTRFTVYLPAGEGRTEPRASPPARRGSELVLLADDEDAVRETLARALERFGYSVLTARDGEEAWRLWSENEGRVALAVLDVSMPRLDGPGLYRRIAEKSPAFKALFVSGHPGARACEELRANGLTVLLKPLAPDRLAERMRELLDRRTA